MHWTRDSASASFVHHRPAPVMCIVSVIRMETSAFLQFIRLVVAGDTDRVARRLSAAPALATTASPVGATRQQATDFFFTAISHYLYAGDTALHIAAAAC